MSAQFADEASAGELAALILVHDPGLAVSGDSFLLLSDRARSALIGAAFPHNRLLGSPEPPLNMLTLLR
jgi:hypothetical protein